MAKRSGSTASESTSGPSYSNPCGIFEGRKAENIREDRRSERAPPAGVRRESRLLSFALVLHRVRTFDLSPGTSTMSMVKLAPDSLEPLAERAAAAA